MNRSYVVTQSSETGKSKVINSQPSCPLILFFHLHTSDWKPEEREDAVTVQQGREGGRGKGGEIQTEKNQCRGLASVLIPI
jgi:hypothetical protein